MKSSTRSLLLASFLACGGFAAFAQPSGQNAGNPPMMGADGAMQPNRPMGMRGDMDRGKMEAKIARRHAELKAKLKLSPEQEGAWATFTAAMKPPAHADHKRPDIAEMEKLSTPERIDKMRAVRTQRMADMSASMDKREDAIKAFYATLNTEQKKTFDAEHARMAKRHDQHHGQMGNRNTEKPAPK